MNRATLSATSLGTFTALLFASCSDIPPGQPGPFTNGAVMGGEMARSATVASAEAFATGSTTGTVAAMTIVILAKHKASEEQRRVALARAKASVAKLRAKEAKAAARNQPARSDRSEPKKAAAKPRKVPRYIAVETVKDERTVKGAQSSLVIFDTETSEIVGNEVYDVRSTPPVGSTARFETFTAEYVGAGL